MAEISCPTRAPLENLWSSGYRDLTETFSAVKFGRADRYRSRNIALDPLVAETDERAEQRPIGHGVAVRQRFSVDTVDVGYLELVAEFEILTDE
jgi:hypothetical protein